MVRRHAACIYRNRAGPGYCPPKNYDYNECDCTLGGVSARTRIECFPTGADCMNKNMTAGEHGYARTRVENVGAGVRACLLVKLYLRVITSSSMSVRSLVGRSTRNANAFTSATSILSSFGTSTSSMHLFMEMMRGT